MLKKKERLGIAKLSHTATENSYKFLYCSAGQHDFWLPALGQWQGHDLAVGSSDAAPQQLVLYLPQGSDRK